MALERKTPLKRGTPLKAGKPLGRGKPLKRGKPIRTKRAEPGQMKAAPKRKPPRSGEIPAATRALVAHRAGYRCEVRVDPDCGSRGLSCHHRLRKEFGDHSPENLVYVCAACHTDGPRALHRNRTWAKACGLIIPAARAKDPRVTWERPPGLEEIPR